MTICYLFPQVECLSRWPGQAENSDFSKRNAACCCWLEVCSQLALSGSIESVAIFFFTRVVILAASVHVRVRWELLPALFAEH